MSRYFAICQRLSALALVMALLGHVFGAPASSQTAERKTKVDDLVADHPLRVFDFYLGRLEPTGSSGLPWTSHIDLEPTIGGRALRFVGRWTKKDQPPEFVEGLIAWDPAEEEIRISAGFYHGVYFEGLVHVLSREKAIVERDWMGYYEDGSSVRYRETWTPVSNDTFEWKIERFINGDWQLHLAPDSSKPSIHRVDRSGLSD